jgi:hypothetical protein
MTKELSVDYIPSEVAIAGVYFPPLLLAGMLGAMAAWLTVMLLNRYRLSRFFFYPPLILWPWRSFIRA